LRLLGRGLQNHHWHGEVALRPRNRIGMDGCDELKLEVLDKLIVNFWSTVAKLFIATA
jgi:hypothetical protein